MPYIQSITVSGPITENRTLAISTAEEDKITAAYQKFSNRRITAADAAATLNRRRRYDSVPVSNKHNKRKIIWCLLLSITLLLLAIAFFTATACVSLRAMLEGTDENEEEPENRTKSILVETEETQANWEPLDRFTSPTKSPNATGRQIRIGNSSGWIEAAQNILSSIDFDANPCEDFYQYACGVWPLKNPLGANRSTHTIYTIVARRVSDEVRRAIESLNVEERKPKPKPPLLPNALRIVKLTYEACIDTDRMTKEGSQDLLKLLNDPNNGIGNWPLISSIIHPDQTDRSLEADTKIHSDRDVTKSDIAEITIQLVNADHNSTINGSNDGNTAPAVDRPVEENQRAELARTIGALKNRYGIDTVVFTYVGADQAKSSANVLQLSAFMLPLGLGLFKAPYYLNDSKHGRVMAAYADLINKTANLLLRDAGYVNESVNQSHVQEIVNFERQLAAHVLKVDTNFHRKWTLQKLIKEMPFFDWRAYLESLLPRQLHRLLDDDKLQLDVPSKRFLVNVLSLLNRTDPVVVQNYLIWRLVKYSLPYLGPEYREALQKLNSLMTGAHKSTPIWQSCIDYVQGRYDMPGLGYATGRIFIDKKFGPGSKSDVEAMVKGILDSFQSIIENLEWMDHPTKQVAIDKSQTMTTHVAYPDWIKDNRRLNQYYSNLTISRSDSMFRINLKLRGWSVSKNQLQLIASTNRKDFGGPPSATNAWYSATNNALTVPAGELQPPFYKSTYPLSINYGAIGSVIGHEMMHGFDSQGSRYDALGRLRRWWSEESMDEFDERTKCLEQEYGQFCYPEIDDRLCVDGEHTVGENTADLGGLKAAYIAYKKLSHKLREKPPSLPGPAMYFTHDQLFFLSFASFWCGSSTEATLRDQLITNHHTPAKYRVIGTLRNTPAFAKAFQCPIGSYMNPEEKCDIW